MAEYHLHCFAQSGNSYKAALMLNLIGADWAPVFVDFFKGETRSDAYRADVNEMGEAPVLTHGSKKLSQSGVILTYLAGRSGKFGGESEDERLEALRWIMFDNHKFTSNYAMHRFQSSLTPEPVHPAILSFLRARTEASCAIVDKHLADRPFMLRPLPGRDEGQVRTVALERDDPVEVGQHGGTQAQAHARPSKPPSTATTLRPMASVA